MKTVSTTQIKPFFMWDAESFRKVHICQQKLGMFYVALCGANTDDPSIPDDPEAVSENMICQKCNRQHTGALTSVQKNTRALIPQVQDEPDEEDTPVPSGKTETRPNLYMINHVGHSITILDYNGKRVLGLRPTHYRALVDRDYKTNGRWLGNIMLKDLRPRVVLEDASRRSIPFPEPRAGVIYIVPSNAQAVLAAQGRDDVYSPGPVFHDATGSIIGCIGLAQYTAEEA